MWEGRKYTTAKTTDNYRDKLSAVPEAETCGWLKDNFGVSWQIGPTILGQIMCDPSKSERVIKAFLSMKKFDNE